MTTDALAARSPCPWAPWTSSSTAAWNESFAQLASAKGARADERALCHVARVKLRKVRHYLAGERVSELARRRIEMLLSNAGRVDLLATWRGER